MKQPRNFSANERAYLTKSIANIVDWQISKKENDMWLIVHKFTRQEKRVLAP